jgi:LysM repeat protein
MKKHMRLLITTLFLAIMICVVTLPNIKPVDAGAWGPVELLNATCSGVTARFYFDGQISHIPPDPTGWKTDRFRLQAYSRTCPTGTSCNSLLAETWQDIPSSFGFVTMSAGWTNQINGTGIELVIAEYNVNDNPSTVLDRDMVGIKISAFYTCGGGITASAYAPPQAVYVPPTYTAPQTQPQQVQVYATGALAYACPGTGVTVMSGGLSVLQATFAQISGPLAMAMLTGQNQPITSGNGVSLWALKSNELQVHYDMNPDATKVIAPSSVCGAINFQQVYTAAAQTSAPTTYTYQQAAVSTAGRTTHVVQPGENLYRISLRYGRTMQAIAAANGISNYDLIYAGQVLIIP